MSGSGSQVEEKIYTILKNWIQGDCLLTSDLPIPLVFSSNNPITIATKNLVEEADENELKDALSLAYLDGYEGVVIITQTCDLIRHCNYRPYIQVSALLKIDNDVDYINIKKGRQPRYAYIPLLEEKKIVADLDIITFAEKAILLEYHDYHHRGCKDDYDLRIFQQSLTRKSSRFAFPDSFVENSKKLSNKIKKKHARDSEEGRALEGLIEIRIKASPSWNDNPNLDIYFISDEHSFISKGNQFSLQRYADDWIELINNQDCYKGVYAHAVTYDDMTAQDYIDSDRLDLDHLSLT